MHDTEHYYRNQAIVAYHFVSKHHVGSKTAVLLTKKQPNLTDCKALLTFFSSNELM